MGTSYNPRIVTDGLVLCLDAANTRSYPGTGTTWTDLKGDNDGTLNNMDANFVNDNAGGLTLDGTDEYISIPLPSTANGSPNQSFTISASLNLTSLTGGNSDISMSNYGISSTTGFFALHFSNKSTLATVRSWIRNTSGGQATTSYVEFLRAEYNYLTFVRDADLNKIYVYVNNKNGTLSSSANFTGSHSAVASNNNDSFYLGKHLSAYSVGKFYQYHVYDRALSAEELRQNYLATKGRYK
tara:strand:+ start:1704 stop:2426 length:723 start_codon:yes stop_codon:yes gene_type:complete